MRENNAPVGESGPSRNSTGRPLGQLSTVNIIVVTATLCLSGVSIAFGLVVVRLSRKPLNREAEGGIIFVTSGDLPTAWRAVDPVRLANDTPDGYARPCP